MDDIRVARYRPEDKTSWDSFVASSKNGTFLFYRDYMDYHADRFEDHSLIVSDAKGQVMALLPGNSEDSVLVSHGGLTYGGFITDECMRVLQMLDIFQATRFYLKQNGFMRLHYKTIPHIYHRIPAEEDSYALFQNGAILHRRDVSTVAIPALEPRFQARRRRCIKKARKAGVSWGASEDYASFWEILEHNLQTVHHVRPVHTLDEIRSLQTNYPNNIRLFCSFLGGEPIAGTVIYETDRVAHAQYIASSDQGKSCGALDLLFWGLLSDQYKEKSYFDFGISTEQEGRYLNTGLIDFKEGFGGRAVSYDSYALELQ